MKQIIYELLLNNDAHFRYLKGRITYDQMNKFIDGMNAAYLSKYKLLRQKKSSLNDANRKRYENYKSLETKDTAGTVRVKKINKKKLGFMEKNANGKLSISRRSSKKKKNFIGLLQLFFSVFFLENVHHDLNIW